MPKPVTLPYAAGLDPKPYSVGLHFAGGGSDKVYNISIEPRDDGWVVNFSNGRRGGTLACGTKTKSPVDYAAAARICNALLAEKVGKGYLPVTGSGLTEGAAAEAIETVLRRSSGFVPQLLNPIADDDVEAYLKDDRYVAQEKIDGERRTVTVSDGEVVAGNRKGQVVALSRPIRDALVAMERDFRLDGEQVGDLYHVFDIVAVGPSRTDGPGITVSMKDLSSRPMEERGRFLACLDFAPGSPVRVVPTAVGEEAKRALLTKVTAGNGEGIVFKKADAPYVAGRPNSAGDQVKFKLHKTLSAIVTASREGKRSVGLALVGEDGRRMGVGNVTVPASHAVPEEGAVVEIRYLYAYDGGSLVQPVFLGVRADVTSEECLATQRVFKADDATEEMSGPRF